MRRNYQNKRIECMYLRERDIVSLKRYVYYLCQIHCKYLK